MPGTIQVSVLDIVGVQSSTPSSQMRVKVSVGKREYQTLNKGDFSFPLTTLRDNVIVTLEDKDGNEISHTDGIDLRLLIAKGIWDDVFPLDGGGHVHLKLQFFLSEDDRQRIRIMRESALRKKQGELVSSESRTMVKYVKRDDFVRKNPSPNETERCADTSSALVNEVKKERSVVFSTDETVSKRQKPLEKAGSVRNMISAFESSRQPDVQSRLRQQMTKSQSVNNLVDFTASGLKVRSTDSLSRNLSSTALHKHDTADNIFMGEETAGNQNMKHTVKPKTPNFERGKSLVDVHPSDGSSSGSKMDKVTSKVPEPRETASDSRISDPKSTHGGRSDSSLLGTKKHSSSDMMARQSDSTMCRKGSQEMSDFGVRGDEHRSPECSGAWIFPDQGKRLCVTTAGKQVFNIIGGFCSERKSTNTVVQNRIEHFIHADTDTAAKERGEEGGDSRTEGSRDVDVTPTPRGPLEQVMRAAIMAGFAALVVFTRQRKPAG